MSEKQYRASQILRILGSPVAYRIVHCLARRRRRPSDLAKELHCAPSTIVNHLKALKLCQICRYHSVSHGRTGRATEYWIRDPKIVDILRSVEEFVARSYPMA